MFPESDSGYPGSTQQNRKISYPFFAFPRKFLPLLARLTGNQFKAFFAVAMHCLHNGKFEARSIPMAELSAATGMHRSALSAAFRELEEAHKVLRVTRATKHVSKYEVLFASSVVKSRHQRAKKGSEIATPETAQV